MGTSEPHSNLESTGDGPLADLGVVESGSPAISHIVSDTGNSLLSGLGIGQILNVTGVNDANGDPAISATAGNNPGDTGPMVKQMQNALIGKKFSVGSAGADGVFNSDTLVALQSFQDDNTLPVQALCDQKCWTALGLPGP